MSFLKYLVWIQFLVAVVNANCAEYQGMFNWWNVITSTDASIVRGEFEGRSYVAWTANLQNFAVGRSLGLRCSSAASLSAWRIVATEGNFCGGSAEASGFENMHNTGSNIDCNLWVAGSDCGLRRISPLSTGNPWPTVNSLVGFLNGIPQTGSCSNHNGDLHCSSTSPSSPLQAFHVHNWHLVRNIASIPAGTTIVFFVRGGSVDFGNFGTAVTESRNVVYYFPDATLIRTFNVAIFGGFLAPHASVTAKDGQLRGWSYARSISITDWGTKVRSFTMSCDFRCPFTGQIVVNQACTCPSGQQVITGKCGTCPYSGQTVVNQACVCPTGQQVIGGKCGTCPFTGQLVVNQACICPSGQQVISGVCGTCSYTGQVVVNQACTCPAGQEIIAVVVGGVCGTCRYTGETVVNQACTCPSGQQVISGACGTCPYPGQIVANQVCTCPTGQKVIGGVCGTCPYTGQIVDNQACICPSGQQVIAGTCGTCPYIGQIVLGQTCSCPYGQALVQGSCKLETQIFESSIIEPAKISSTKDFSYLTFQTVSNLYWYSESSGVNVRVMQMSGTKDPTPFLFFMRTVSRLITYSFKGCYVDNLQSPAMETFLGVYNVSECANAASSQNFKFFGIQNFGRCYATNSETSLSKYGVTLNHYCMFACSVDKTPLQKEGCGKDGASAVYELSYALYVPVTDKLAIGDRVQIILPGAIVLFLKNMEVPPITEDTFVVERADNGYVRFQSFTSETTYIRVLSGQITIAKDDGSAAFKSDSSFLIRLNIGAAPLPIRETNADLQKP